MKLRHLLGTATLIAALHGPSYAADVILRTVWTVVPSEAPSEPVKVAPGEFVTKSRLVPLGLAKLGAPFSGQKPSDALPAGTELIRAFGSGPAVFCATTYRPPGALASIWMAGDAKGRFPCFVDNDWDSRFDEAFLGWSNVRPLPGIAGRMPKKRTPIEPLAYAEVESASFSQNLYVGPRYFGQAKIGTLRRFYTAYGSDQLTGQLTDNIFTKRDSDLPKTLEIMGGEFTVLGGEGEKVVVRVDRTLPPQPFSVTVTTTTYYVAY